MAWSSTPTLLSLTRFAQIMGIDPVHFEGATVGEIFPVANRCTDVWPQHSWQASDRVSREDLGRLISDAESEIADLLGYWPAPTWTAQEVRDFPRYYRPDVWRRGGSDVRGQRIGFRTKYGKIISPGIRAVSLIETATVAGGSLAYTDTDGDNFFETATVTVSTTVTDINEIKVYFQGESGRPEWEIREPRTKSLSGGIATLVFDSWLFIDRDLLEAYPTTAGFSSVSLYNTTARFVTSVDVYREYTDTTTRSAVFYWEPGPTFLNALCPLCGGSGCSACTLTTQNGCIHIRDAEGGLVVPVPATYSSTSGTWSQAAYSVCRDPDMVKVYYYSGKISDRVLGRLSSNGRYINPLDDRLARTIAYLATARLERPMCSCANVRALSQELMMDTSYTPAEGGSFFLSDRDRNNPFGTKVGEVRAYRTLMGISGDRVRRMKGVAV